MSISSRITQIEQHLADDYSVLQVAGADLTNIDKNIVNLKPTWQERLLYFMDNGTEEVWNNWNKATGEGTSISLYNTLEAKMKIELKGNTYQEGTPTPDTPQEVQTVTGEQTISVTGKNLFDKNNVVDEKFINNLGNLDYSANYYASDYMIVYGHQKVTTSGNTFIEIGHSAKIAFYTSNKTFISYSDIAIGNNTYTIPDNAYYMRISIRKTDVNNTQVEIGSQATSYEPYKSQTYEINLGKNLFDSSLMETWGSTIRYIPINVEPNTNYTLSTSNPGMSSSTANIFLSTSNSGVSSNNNGVWLDRPRTINSGNNNVIYVSYRGSIDDKTNYWYQLERGNQATSYSPYKTPIGLCKVGNYQDFIRKGTGKNLFDYTTSVFSLDNVVDITTENNVITITTRGECTSGQLFFRTKIPDEYLQNGETYTISSVNVSGVAQSLRLQLRNKDGSNANKSQLESVVYDDTYSLYIVRNIFATTGTTIIPAGTTAIIENVQVEKGSTATLYEPYGYKDKWYMYKAIDKVVLDGSESTATYSNYTYFWTTTNYLRNDKGGKIYCSHFKGSANGGSTNVNLNAWAGNSSTLCFRDNTKSSLAIWQEWLNNNNVTCYYMLGTPTYEEITDSELLSQLEALLGARSYQGQTNINQENSNLASILNATALEEL